MEYPRSEHPKPQMERAAWRCLNGEWEFAFDFSRSGEQRNMAAAGTYPMKILVPFCPESKLSGIGFTDFIPACWYRRTFDLSDDELSGRVLLHFGAVDSTAHLHQWGNGWSTSRRLHVFYIGHYRTWCFWRKYAMCLCRG